LPRNWYFDFRFYKISDFGKIFKLFYIIKEHFENVADIAYQCL